MAAETLKPKWLTDEVMAQLRADIAACPEPYTDEEFDQLELDGTMNFKRADARSAIKILTKYGISHS